MLDRHGIDGERAEEIGEAIAAGAFETAFDRVSEAMIAAFCIAGTPKTVETQLEEVMEDADSVVVSSPLGPDPEEAIRLTGAVCDRWFPK